MLKIFLIAFALYQAASCGQRIESPAPIKPPNDSSRVAASPTPTPADRTVSECSKTRAKGLAAGINIPQELCFDPSKPVDAKERSNAKIGNSPQTSTIEATDLTFDELPAEVQKIVRITAPEMNTNQVVFDLTMIPTPDEKSKNRLVKSYSYASSSKNKAPGKDENRHSWLFKRQNDLLKLEYAEIDTTK